MRPWIVVSIFVYVFSGPQLFWHQGLVSWKIIFPWTREVGGWFWNDSRMLPLICTLFLLLLHQFHPSSSRIRSWRLGSPIFKYHPSLCFSWSMSFFFPPPLDKWNSFYIRRLFCDCCLLMEYIKDVYCHPAYLTYMQSTSWETLD